MDMRIKSAKLLIGGDDPEHFSIPNGMKCFVVPPPNGRNAISNILFDSYINEFHGFMKNFSNNVDRALELTGKLESIYEAMEDYEEAIIVNDDISIISYLEVWENMAIIFVDCRKYKSGIKKLSEFSKDAMNYINNIEDITSSNILYTKNIRKLISNKN